MSEDIHSDNDSDNDNKDFDDYRDSELVGKLEKSSKRATLDDEKTEYPDDDDDDDDDDYDIIETNDYTEEEFEIIHTNHKDKITDNTLNIYKKEYIIPVDERTTSNKINLFEYSRLITTRCSMISQGSIPLVNINNIDSEEEIAILEIKSRKIPLLIKRYVGLMDGTVLIEIWDPKEMTLPTNI